jgi:hypothetical protein
LKKLMMDSKKSLVMTFHGIAVILLTLACSMGRAELLDVTASGSQATSTAAVGGQFYVTQQFVQPAGTGNVNSFLRLQHDDSEQGYNTDAKQPPLNDKAGNWTHSLQLSGVPVVSESDQDT